MLVIAQRLHDSFEIMNAHVARMEQMQLAASLRRRTGRRTGRGGQGGEEDGRKSKHGHDPAKFSTYNIGQCQTIQLPTEAHSRVGHKLVFIRNQLFCIGGTTVMGMLADPLEVLDPVKGCWSLYDLTGDTHKLRRVGASAVTYLDRFIIVFGGFVPSWGSSHTRDVIVVDLQTDSVMSNITVTGELPHPRDKHAAVVYQDKMYVFGGWGADVPNQPEFVRASVEENGPMNCGWNNTLHSLDLEPLRRFHEETLAPDRNGDGDNGEDSGGDGENNNNNNNGSANNDDGVGDDGDVVDDVDDDDDDDAGGSGQADGPVASRLRNGDDHDHSSAPPTQQRSTASPGAESRARPVLHFNDLLRRVSHVQRRLAEDPSQFTSLNTLRAHIDHAVEELVEIQARAHVDGGDNDDNAQGFRGGAGDFDTWLRTREHRDARDGSDSSGAVDGARELQLHWRKEETTGERPAARAAHTAELCGDTLVVFGGRTKPCRTNDFNTLHLPSMEWSGPWYAEGDEIPPRSWQCAAFVPPHHLFLQGGFTTNKDPLSDVFVVDLKHRTATQLPTHKPTLWHAAVYIEPFVYFFGGSTSSEPRVAMRKDIVRCRAVAPTLAERCLDVIADLEGEELADAVAALPPAFFPPLQRRLCTAPIVRLPLKDDEEGVDE